MQIINYYFVGLIKPYLSNATMNLSRPFNYFEFKLIIILKNEIPVAVQ
jgi:hypothetical protein